jgi:hypothetical protein
MSLEHSPARQRADASANPFDASLTIKEFCKAEKISRSMLYRAWSEGWGPKFYWVGVTRRITCRARLEWQHEREAEADAATDRITRSPRRAGEHHAQQHTKPASAAHAGTTTSSAR